MNAFKMVVNKFVVGAGMFSSHGWRVVWWEWEG